jgi:Ser/Thr protein kinase RdoA (MazF antagonist)
MPRPAYTHEQAREIAERHFGVRVGELTPLPSYDDQNLRLELLGDERSDHVVVVLKIAAAEAECRGFCDADATRGMMEMENQAMSLMAAAGVSVPTPLLTVGAAGDGADDDGAGGAAAAASAAVVQLQGLGGDSRPEAGVCFARLISFLPGTLLAKVAAHPPCLLRRLGAALGRMDRALAGWSHPCAARDLTWDLANASRAREFLGDVADERQRTLASRALQRFEATVVPRLGLVPRQVVHGDVNDYNVLVTPAALVAAAAEAEDTEDIRGVGIVDFGDMVETARVCNLAVALAYICMGKEQPLEVAASVVAAYHGCNALAPLELEMIWPMIAARNCQSALHAAHGAIAEPDNPYLLVSAQPAWDLLAKTAAVDPADALAALRTACGLPPRGGGGSDQSQASGGGGGGGGQCPPRAADSDEHRL